MGADNLICLSNTGNRISCYFLFFFFFFYWDCFVLFCFVLRDKEVTDFSTESQSRTVIFEFGYKSPIYRFFSVQQCSAAIKWWTAPKISNDRIVFFFLVIWLRELYHRFQCYRNIITGSFCVSVCFFFLYCIHLSRR